MPDFSLADYIALRSIVLEAELRGYDADSIKVIERAKSALHSLRKFFPSFDLWEREQLARQTI